MNLVVDHVLESLVVRRPEVDLRLELASRVPVVHDLEPARVVAVVLEEVRDGFDGDLGERSRVAFVPRDRRDCETSSLAYCTRKDSKERTLAEETLDQMSNGHARRNSVRVDDDVGSRSLGREGHVLLPVGDSDRSLLTVTRGKLVADLRDSSRAHADLDKFESLRVRRLRRGVSERTQQGRERKRTTRTESTIPFSVLLSGVETSRLV